MNWLKKLFHKHDWIVFHPTYYQDNVRMKRCLTCYKINDLGAKGERGQNICHGFDATTGKTLLGGKGKYGG